MELTALVVVSGLAGGIVVALLLGLAHRLRPGRRAEADGAAVVARGTDVINMASIRVAGVGGLGLVAMSLALAWSIPRIGQTIAFGAVLGGAMAFGLILWRRRVGPMPTSGGRAGANTTLSIDHPADPQSENVPESSDRTLAGYAEV
jgi:hypothetical protein